MSQRTVCKFTKEMFPALQRAVEYSDMTEELAEVLSTLRIEIKYHVKRGVAVCDE